MDKKSRYAILAVVVVAVVAAVAYVATRGGGQRTQGLVGPQGPPPR